MRRERYARFLIWGLIAVVVMRAWDISAAGVPTTIPAKASQRVLVLYSDERLLPANIIIDNAIRSSFATGTSNQFELYSEFLDGARFPGEKQEQRQRDFFRDKYQARPPHLVITVSGAALAFAVKYRAAVFAGAPIVHCSFAGDPHPQELQDATIPEVPVFDAVGPTLDLALRLQPDTRLVAVVSGSSPRDVQLTDALRKDIPLFEKRVGFTWLTNRSLPELRDELSRLSDRTVVLYLTMFEDADGRSFTPRLALDRFADASRSPIYAYYDTYLGHGIVGGSMVTFEVIGRKTARVGLRILAGEDAQSAARTESAQPAPMFDWSELRRWNINEKRLPPDSEVRFRPPTLWESHKDYVIGGLAIFVAQAVTITALLVHRSRRRIAERAAREEEKRMALAANAARLGLWIWDIPRKSLWVSQRGKQLFGHPLNAVLTLDVLGSRVHPEDRALRDEAIQRALAGGGIYNVDYRVRLPDGAMCWIASNGHVEFDDAGKAVLARGVVVDITQRKLAEQDAHDLSGRLIHAQEAERARLARELHDDLSQSLALLSVELEMLGQKPPVEREAITSLMRKFSSDVRRLSSEVHRLSHELHPSMLEQLGLVAAVRGFCRELAIAHKIAIEFEPHDMPRVPTNDVSLCLYRIIQEALQNVIRHGAAAGVKVELQANEGKIQLIVTDDGHGFDPEAIQGKGSLGIVSMRERVRMVDGQISVRSRPGDGTRIEVWVPFVAPAGEA